MSSDSEIALKYSVKRSTFSTVKRQLIEKGYISSINIPNVLSLGASVIALGTVRFNPNEMDKFRENRPREILSRIHYFPNLVSVAFESYNGISLLISKSFTDVILAHNASAGFYLENNLSTPSDLSLFINSLSDKAVHYFMEYGRFLEWFWNHPAIKSFQPSPIFPFSRIKINQISSLGWEIYNKIIENPGSSILELSEICDKPRNTIARWLRLFQENHLYTTRYIPDLKKLGLKIQTYYKLSVQGLDVRNKQRLLILLKRTLYPIILISGLREIILYTVADSYSSHREAETRLLNALEREKIGFQLVNKMNFSINNVRFPKEFQKSLPKLIEYLKNPDKFSLQPFKEEKISDKYIQP
jgi:hypothetical protein